MDVNGYSVKEILGLFVIPKLETLEKDISEVKEHGSTAVTELSKKFDEFIKQEYCITKSNVSTLLNWRARIIGGMKLVGIVGGVLTFAFTITAAILQSLHVVNLL
jgi:hypothetical protein